jgi:formamidopyrimidine-DNA glycosylase
LSIELPEAHILSKQMSQDLVGKEVTDCTLKDYVKFQNLGFINKQSSDFNKLCGGKIQSVVSRGNVIRVKFNNGMNLLLAPEYGGKILYHTKESDAPSKFHLKVRFGDGTVLTVTLTGMGVIHVLADEELENSYVYRRDFSSTTSPMDDKEFTFERFSKELADKKVNVKSVLVGKEAIVVGLGNSAFQDILYRAGIHPKRKAADLAENEKHALYDAIKSFIQQRIKLGGKNQFIDLYGKQGCYIPVMGPNMKDKACPVCGTQVEKLSLSGGQVYICPKCQH